MIDGSNLDQHIDQTMLKNGYMRVPMFYSSGHHEVVATITDKAGNTSSIAKDSITFDTVAHIKDDTSSIDEGKTKIHGNVLTNDEHPSVVTTTNTMAGKFGTYHIDAKGHFIYTLDNQKVDHLAVGQHETDSVSYSITDRAGNIATATLTTTIVGTNDKPVMSASTVNVHEGDALLSGAMNAHDVDSGATLTFSATNLPAGFKLNSDGTYTFDAKDGAYDHLKAGAKETLTIPVTVIDEHGATDVKNLTIHMVGTNDKAVIKEVLTEEATEDVHTVAKGVLSITDKDDTEAHFQAHRYNGQYGQLQLTKDGHWTYHLDNSKVNNMADGEIKQDFI